MLSTGGNFSNRTLVRIKETNRSGIITNKKPWRKITKCSNGIANEKIEYKYEIFSKDEFLWATEEEIEKI